MANSKLFLKSMALIQKEITTAFIVTLDFTNARDKSLDLMIMASLVGCIQSMKVTRTLLTSMPKISIALTIPIDLK